MTKQALFFFFSSSTFIFFHRSPEKKSNKQKKIIREPSLSQHPFRMQRPRLVLHVRMLLTISFILSSVRHRVWYITWRSGSELWRCFSCFLSFAPCPLSPCKPFLVFWAQNSWEGFLLKKRARQRWKETYTAEPPSGWSIAFRLSAPFSSFVLLYFLAINFTFFNGDYILEQDVQGGKLQSSIDHYREPDWNEPTCTAGANRPESRWEYGWSERESGEQWTLWTGDYDYRGLRISVQDSNREKRCLFFGSSDLRIFMRIELSVLL